MTNFFLKGLTGSKEGQAILYKCKTIIKALGKLAAEDKDPVVSKESLLCLVNLSAEEDGAAVLLKSVKLITRIQNLFYYFYCVQCILTSVQISNIDSKVS